MKRLILIGMMVVFVAIAALPAVAIFAGAPGFTSRSTDTSFKASARAEYNKPHKKPCRKGKHTSAKAGGAQANAGKGCAKAKAGGAKAKATKHGAHANAGGVQTPKVGN